MTAYLSQNPINRQGVFKSIFLPDQFVNGTDINISKTMRYGKRGHYGWPKPSPQMTNVGGDFYLDGVETYYGISQVGEVWKTANDHWQERYIGNLVSMVDSAGFGGDFLPDSFGPSAYNKMKPTQPKFSGLVSLAELREVPELIKGLKVKVSNLKDLGNYHLAIQFGWLPTMNDILNLINLQRTMNKTVNQLLRDNGKPVRRSCNLLDEMSDPIVTEGENWGYFYPNLATGFFKSNPTFRQQVYNRDQVWASARFRYWLPPGPKDIKYRQALIHKLYGLELTPSAAWNLIPWSWLVDWFTSVGDSLENLDAGVADRCAADYFYVMRHKEKVIERSANYLLAKKDGSLVSFHSTAKSTGFHKSRGAGDPFGWRINENSLSLMQTSILGALGMSRLR